MSRRRVVVLAWTLWGSVCALSLLLIVLTIAFHLITRYEWWFWFADSFHAWRVLTVEAFGVLGAPLLGALIVWRQPTNRYGWVWCLLGLAMAVRGAAFAYQLWAWFVAPIQPFGYEAVWLGNVMFALALGLVPLVLVLFPDGRPPSTRWRPVVWATMVVCLVRTRSTGSRGTPYPPSWPGGWPTTWSCQSCC